MSWFWLWLLFLVVLLVLPLVYGWGYRGWGAPYPSFGRRRVRPGDPASAVSRRQEATAVDAETAGWGILADVVWLVALVALIWLLLALIF